MAGTAQPWQQGEVAGTPWEGGADPLTMSLVSPQVSLCPLWRRRGFAGSTSAASRRQAWLSGKVKHSPKPSQITHCDINTVQASQCSLWLGLLPLVVLRPLQGAWQHLEQRPAGTPRLPAHPKAGSGLMQLSQAEAYHAAAFSIHYLPCCTDRLLRELGS